MELTHPNYSKTKSWKTVKQFVEKHKFFTEPSLRYFLFHRKVNGLDKYVRQIGNKILLDEYGITNEWIERNGEDA